MDGRRMDTMGQDTPLRFAAVQWHQWHHSRRHRMTEEVVGQPTCTFSGVYACQLSVCGRVALSVPRGRSDGFLWYEVIIRGRRMSRCNWLGASKRTTSQGKGHERE